VKSAESDLDRKFWAALGMFAILAVLVWLTMGDGSVLVFGRPVELKLIPLIVIGGMALRTVLARHAEKIRRAGEKDSS
jgi:class 3 adenylate cyclase